MPQLFTGPQFVALSALNTPLPGAKLTFTQTGTSTPQNVYQDLALTVPHANPVVANGAGVFSKIYLDPSLPNYRVLLTDSSDVPQPGYPIDDYPSNQNTGQTFRLKSAAPELIFEETDASAGNKKWRVRVNAEQMRISLLNDAESVATDLAIIDRTGSTVDLINLLATQVQVNSLEALGSLAVRKTVNTDRSSTTTLADDPELTLSVPVAGTYRIETVLNVVGLTGGSGGFKFNYSFDNGSANAIGGCGLEQINAGAAAISSLGTALSLIGYAAPVTEALIRRIDYATLTPSGAMTIKLQWAQLTSDADITRLLSGSLISIARISA
jgi:hypothetical protein